MFKYWGISGFGYNTLPLNIILSWAKKNINTNTKNIQYLSSHQKKLNLDISVTKKKYLVWISHAEASISADTDSVDWISFVLFNDVKTIMQHNYCVNSNKSCNKSKQSKGRKKQWWKRCFIASHMFC